MKKKTKVFLGIIVGIVGNSFSQLSNSVPRRNAGLFKPRFSHRACADRPQE